MTDIKSKLTPSLFLISLALLIGGCEENTSPVAGKRNPDAQYGDNLIGVQEGSEIEAQQAILKDMKNAIRFYHASKGKYPEHISKIKKSMCSGIDPDKYHYNPQNGMVKLKKR